MLLQLVQIPVSILIHGLVRAYKSKSYSKFQTSYLLHVQSFRYLYLIISLRTIRQLGTYAWPDHIKGACTVLWAYYTSCCTYYTKHYITFKTGKCSTIKMALYLVSLNSLSWFYQPEKRQMCACKTNDNQRRFLSSTHAAPNVAKDTRLMGF